MSIFKAGPSKSLNLDSLNDVKGFSNASSGVLYGFKRQNQGLPYEPEAIGGTSSESLFTVTFTRSGAYSDSSFPFSVGDAEKTSRSSFVLPAASELVYATINAFTSSNVGTDNTGGCSIILNDSILSVFISKPVGEISNVITYDPRIMFPKGSRIGLYATETSADARLTTISLFFLTSITRSTSISSSLFLNDPPATQQEIAEEDAATALNSTTYNSLPLFLNDPPATQQEIAEEDAATALNSTTYNRIKRSGYPAIDKVLSRYK